jgi:peptidyl-prolyl cis-trans isomerase D
LRQAGFQPNNFRDFMRVDMVRRQLSKSLMGSEFTLENEAKSTHLMQQQTRNIRFVNVSSAKFIEQVEVTDEQVLTFYQANISQFDTQQKLSLAYVELKLEDLMTNIEVSEEELVEYYTQNQANYRIDEERQTSHILFESIEEDPDIEAQAEDVLAKVLAGDDFAVLAKTFSSDTFSAENGGDLGWFGKGIMDPAFEEATFALVNKDDVSAVVKSDFGYHIIKLTDVKPEQISAFDEVKESIIIEVKTAKAEEEFYIVQQDIAEAAFEIPDNLDQVAELAGKPILTTSLFSRNNAPVEVSNPKVLADAFSAKLIEDRFNSEVIELSQTHIILVRVAEYEPQRTQSIDEVTAQISQTLSTQDAQQAARDWANDVKTKLANNEDVSSQLDTLEVSWEEQKNVSRTDSALSRNVVEAVFKLAANEINVIDLVAGDISLLQITQINPAVEADEQQLTTLQEALATNKSQVLYGAIVESLKAQADIEIY